MYQLFSLGTPFLLFLVFLPFVKSPRDTLGLAQCAHPLLNPSPPSHTLILYLYPFLYLHPFTLKSSTLTHKHPQNHIFKNESPPKTTNNPTYPPNHPQLIFTFPSSASSTPPPQTQHIISPLQQSSFHPSSPLETTSEFYSGMLTGFTLVVLNSYNSSLTISTILSSYKSHTYPLTPLSVYPATKPSKGTVL